MLEDQHRVRVGQRRREHVAGVLDDGRREHAQPRDMGIPAFEAVRMLRRDLPPAAGRHADHQRHRELAARHVRDRRGVVDDLIERQQAEIHGHDLDNRPHPGQRRADPGADKGALRQRRIANALLPEFVEQALGHGVAAAVAPDILAHQKALGISRRHRAGSPVPCPP